MLVQSLNCGARGRTHLVEDDLARFVLLEEIAAAFGEDLLAYILLLTHLHVLVAGETAAAIARLEAALAAYARFVEGRGHDAPLLRGPIHAVEKTDPAELMRTIAYLHKNANDVRGIERSLEYAWSSERAYVGLRVESPANVGRALGLLGRTYAPAVRGPSLPLAGLEPEAFPAVHPDVIAAAAADAFGVPPYVLPEGGRDRAATRARAAFLRVGKLEGYSTAALAPLIARSDSRASTIISGTEVSGRALRIVRTLARDPGVARHLPRAPLAARAQRPG